MKKYIFRLDDISWDMNYENFKRIKQLFTDYGIKPIIGVIPKNEDPNFCNRPRLQSSLGIFASLLRLAYRTNIAGM